MPSTFIEINRLFSYLVQVLRICEFTFADVCKDPIRLQHLTEILLRSIPPRLHLIFITRKFESLSVSLEPDDRHISVTLLICWGLDYRHFLK